MKNKYDEKINFRYNLNIYWELAKKHKLGFVIVLLFILSLEAVSVAEKYLFKIIVDDGAKFVERSFLLDAYLHILIVVAFVYLGIVFYKAVSKFIYFHILNRLESKMIYDLKKKFFDHLIDLDHSFHVSHKTGSLISRLGRGSSAVERLTDNIMFNFAPLIFQLIVAGVSLVYISWIPLAIISVTLILFVSFNFYMQQIQQDPIMKATKAEDYEKGVVADIFTNVDSIKYFGKAAVVQNKFAKLSWRTRNIVMKQWDYHRWLDAIQSVILGLGTFALLYFSIKEFLTGGMTLGDVTFIYTVFGALLSSLYGFVYGIRDFYRVMADFEALFQYNKIEKEIKDTMDARKMKIEKGEIEFRNVSFKYGRRKIFEKFNLKINKNEKVALVGHSGCGKTTLIKLLYRLYDVDSGAILIDGKDIRNSKQESVRSEMSVVPQDCVLFDDTIYNNIAFSNPSAKREDVLKAMKFAQLDKIINTFPNKENTIVGERGVKLSGGEKQRVSIARAILANKKILVLDEATSSLDSETEFEIKKDLDKLMEGRTSIIIAHRLSTIMKTDRIIVMKQGKIVQSGKHNELIEQSGEYRKLWNLQKGGYLQE